MMLPLQPSEPSIPSAQASDAIFAHAALVLGRERRRAPSYEVMGFPITCAYIMRWPDFQTRAGKRITTVALLCRKDARDAGSGRWRIANALFEGGRYCRGRAIGPYGAHWRIVGNAG